MNQTPPALLRFSDYSQNVFNTTLVLVHRLAREIAENTSACEPFLPFSQSQAPIMEHADTINELKKSSIYFPENITVDDAREAIKGRVDFKETATDDYISFVYFLGMKDLFSICFELLVFL